MIHVHEWALKVDYSQSSDLYYHNSEWEQRQKLNRQKVHKHQPYWGQHIPTSCINYSNHIICHKRLSQCQKEWQKHTSQQSDIAENVGYMCMSQSMFAIWCLLCPSHNRQSHLAQHIHCFRDNHPSTCIYTIPAQMLVLWHCEHMPPTELTTHNARMYVNAEFCVYIHKHIHKHVHVHIRLLVALWHKKWEHINSRLPPIFTIIELSLTSIVIVIRSLLNFAKSWAQVPPNFSMLHAEKHYFSVCVWSWEGAILLWPGTWHCLVYMYKHTCIWMCSIVV